MHILLIQSIRPSLISLYGFLLLVLLLLLTGIFFSNTMFTQASTNCKRFLNQPNLLLPVKFNISHPRNMLLAPLGDLQMVSSTLWNLVFLTALTFMTSVALPAVTSRTNLKLLDIPITPVKVKEVITDLDSSKTSGPYCVSLVVL